MGSLQRGPCLVVDDRSLRLQDDIPSWEGIIIDGSLPASMEPPEPLVE